MSNNRSWMYMYRKPGMKEKRDEYFNGVVEFLDFAFAQTECVRDNKIRCPCKKCDFFSYKSREAVELDLLKNGFIPNYERWVRHGESHVEMEIDGNINEAINDNWPREMVLEVAGPEFNPSKEDPNLASKRFYDLLNASDEALWDGCENHSKLSATTRLLHLKSEHVLSNKCIDDLLTFIKECLPNDNKLPETYYRCKVMMKELGLPYEKIHACKNDCVLFWGDYSTLSKCPVCGESRYKELESVNGKKYKPVPVKVLRYFPLIPRLLRLFLSSKTAEHMQWHKERRRDVPGELRHPADGEAWKDLDRNFKEFAKDARNIRLGLATDGFNPFGHTSKPHSTWPVFLVPYNLPPWMCMKEAYMFLTLIIPGPKGPGRELDVYLQPLIHELKILWDGVDAYDAFQKENFKLKAAVLWTISDFPAYGMLSGWSTHGKLSCPVCMDRDIAFNLKEGRKPCYFGCHRRWLKRTHRFRSDKTKFNNKSEHRLGPPRISGAQVLETTSQFESITLGKGDNSNDKTPGFGVVHNWTKKSIFFQLPYWDKLLIRHNLDVMHIEKNVFDNVFYTVMNVKGKSKDHLNARKDLVLLNIRPELHAFQGSNGNWMMPKASYTLNNEQMKQVYQWLGSLKVPDAFAGNISRCFKSDDYKISGLKSHDCHVLMERFLSLAFEDVLPKSVWEPLHALGNFFRDICTKVYKEDELDNLESTIVETLCRLEMIFPPSFFDTMEHLPIHLVYEAKVGGPVQYRWMYPFERCMRKLKRKVTNKACPEGSIAEAYRIEELVNFCSMYFDVNVRTNFNKTDRHDDGGVVEANGRLPIFAFQGRPLGTARRRYLEDDEYYAARLYILSNCSEVYDYINEHHRLMEELYDSSEEREKEHNSTFVKWLENRVKNDENVDPRVKILAGGPCREVHCYEGFDANGFRFHTKKLDPRKATQNSGVLVKGITYDESENDYYGRLLEVIRVEFPGQGNTIFLFKCEWYDNKKGVVVDKYDITKVNTKSRLKSYEPFVFASQALQVFYANSVSRRNHDWCTVIVTKARNTYDVAENEDDETYQEDEPSFQHIFDADENLVLRDESGEDEEVEEEEEEDDDEAADYNEESDEENGEDYNRYDNVDFDEGENSGHGDVEGVEDDDDDDF